MARGHHDIGGLPGAGAIDQAEHQLSDWEVLADAINQALGARGIKRTDEMRRWIASLESILIEKKILTKDEIDRRLAEFEKEWGEP